MKRTIMSLLILLPIVGFAGDKKTRPEDEIKKYEVHREALRDSRRANRQRVEDQMRIRLTKGRMKSRRR